ncbi:MAG: PIN domain-containing protein [Burkholderiales bacterium]|nr:PIN domain-containing protein [Burkholderiales bacterium]MDE2628942.1 PIN domain-containing protein [Burkholderiales bacterium]
MTTFLLDVNVLIALVDPTHVQHEPAHEWFGLHGHKAWATCPLTENGLMRIVGHARYPNSPGTPAAVAQLLTTLRALPGHTFWPDDISLMDANWIDAARLLSAAQVTDSYLLALACAHGGQLASFDRRLVTDAVRDGARRLHLLE